MTTRTTDIPALAAEAIAHEGPDAYFPGLDLDTDLAAEILASYLAAHPDEWTPATDESAWVCRSSDEDLVAWAELHQELEAKLIEAVTAIVSGGCDPDDLADQRAAINAARIGIEAHLDGGAADDAYRGIQVDEGGRLTAWDEGDYCPIEVTARVDEPTAPEATGTVLPIDAATWAWNNYDDAGLTHSCDECSDTELPGCVADLPEVAVASRRLKRWGFEQTYGPGDGDYNLSVAGNGAVPVPDGEVDAVMRAAFGHTD